MLVGRQVDIATDGGPALTAALEAATYGYWTADHDGRLTYASEPFLRMLGRGSDEVLGDGWTQWLAPEVRNLNELAWRTAVRLGQPFERNHVFLTSEGGRKSVLVRANPYEGGWAGLFLEGPSEPEAARPTEIQVRPILEGTTDAFVAMDREFRFTYVNRVASAMIQRSPESIIGLSNWDVYPQLKGTRIEEQYHHALETQQSVHFEHWIPEHDIWLELHIYPSEEGLSVFFRDVSERKRAEARLEIALSGARAAIWEWDFASGRVDWSPQMYDLVGFPRGEVPSSETWFERMHPDDHRWVREEMMRRIEDEDELETIVRVRHTTLGYRYLASFVRVVRDSEGVPIRLVGMNQDVTERQEAEADLLRILDSMPNIAWALDSDQQLAYLNRRYREFAGMEEELIPAAKSWAIVVHPDDRDEAHRSYHAAVQGSGAWEHELRLRRFDGEYRWHLSRLVPMRDSEGRIVRYFGTSTDIHEQKTRQETLGFLLRLTEEMRGAETPEEIMERAGRMLGERLGVDRCLYADVEPDLSFTVEIEYLRRGAPLVGRHRLSDFGEQICRELSGSGRVIFDSLADIEGAEIRDLLRNVGIEATISLSLARAERIVAIVAIHQSTPRHWEPEEIQLVEMFADRCWAEVQRARALRELRELNVELERRVDERTRELEGFTYTVSHDLRAPLRAIVATSRLLQEDAGPRLSSSEQELLDRQIRNARHLATLIDDLLKLSRISRQEMIRTHVDLTEMARKIAGDISGVDFEIGSGLKADGDPVLLQFVLLNLFENAAKFSPHGGTVRLGRSHDAFYVQDEGVGFDPQYAEKIFRPFERLVRQDEYPGTGIGLANVKRIVERHGGRVWAESSPGQGATFWFTLGAEGEQ